jgi:hypothetical protein
LAAAKHGAAGLRLRLHTVLPQAILLLNHFCTEGL